MRSIWSKMATIPVNRQSAKGLSGSSSRMDDRQDRLMRSMNASKVLAKAPNATSSPDEVRRVRLLADLIGAKNSRTQGFHPKGGRYANMMMRRGMTHEELISTLHKYVDDPKYGVRVKAFLAQPRLRTH